MSSEAHKKNLEYIACEDVGGNVDKSVGKIADSNEPRKVFELDVPVGRGRKSIVYRAKPLFEISEIKEVALKVLTEGSRDPMLDIKRLKREATAMRSCSHENIIKLYDYSACEKSPYLAMEYAEYGDLRSLIDLRGKAFQIKDALIMIRQVARGLEAIHKVGIVHRDIKPDNILLSGENVVKIGDFGIAFLPTDEVRKEEANQGIGTFEYLAPECLEDGINNQSTDIYACAISLYELITGELPFAGISFTEKVQNKLSGNVTPLSRFGIKNASKLDAFFSLALSSDSRERYNTAYEFIRACSDLIKGDWKPEKSNVLVMRARVKDENPSDTTVSASAKSKTA